MVDEKPSKVQRVTEQVFFSDGAGSSLSYTLKKTDNQGVEDNHSVLVVIRWYMYSAIALIATKTLHVSPVGSQGIFGT